MARTRSTTAKRPTATGIPLGYFGRLLLYVSLACLLNTLFFVPVPQSGSHPSAGMPATDAPADDPDNSLLELVLEDYFDAPESSSDPRDDVDDVLKKGEYLVKEFAWRPGEPACRELPPQRLTRVRCTAPLLRVLFPPPERLA